MNSGPHHYHQQQRRNTFDQWAQQPQQTHYTTPHPHRYSHSQATFDSQPRYDSQNSQALVQNQFSHLPLQNVQDPSVLIAQMQLQMQVDALKNQYALMQVQALRQAAAAVQVQLAQVKIAPSEEEISLERQEKAASFLEESRQLEQQMLEAEGSSEKIQVLGSNANSFSAIYEEHPKAITAGVNPWRRSGKKFDVLDPAVLQKLKPLARTKSFEEFKQHLHLLSEESSQPSLNMGHRNASMPNLSILPIR